MQSLTVSQLPLVVGYTGVKADTPTLIRKVAALKTQQPMQMQKLFEEATVLVEAAKLAIEQKNWSKLGQLMHQNQLLLDQLGVSSPELDSLITASEQAGAEGAKLSGAGGGDCMIAVTDSHPQAAVAAAIVAAKGTVMSVELSAPGVRIESYV